MGRELARADSRSARCDRLKAELAEALKLAGMGEENARAAACRLAKGSGAVCRP